MTPSGVLVRTTLQTVVEFQAYLQTTEVPTKEGVQIILKDSVVPSLVELATSLADLGSDPYQAMVEALADIISFLQIADLLNLYIRAREL